MVSEIGFLIRDKVMPPKIDKALCTVCGTCVDECPTDVFCIEEKEVVIVQEEKCTECGTCELSCPENAITIVESLEVME